MSKYENIDTNTLIEMAMLQIQKLDALWSATIAQICDRQEQEEKQAA